MSADDHAIDCRSPEGVTIGLIDGIIAAARIVRARNQTHPAVIEALRDIAEDEDVRSLLDAPSAPESPASGRTDATPHTDATGEATEAQEDAR